MNNQEIGQALDKIGKEMAALDVLRGRLPEEQIESELANLRQR